MKQNSRTFQGPTLFSRTFKALNLEKKFKDFQGCVGTLTKRRLAKINSRHQSNIHEPIFSNDLQMT